MTRPHDGKAMGQRPRAGSVKRARERALAGLPRGTPPPILPRQTPDTDDGHVAVAISRPTPVAQWPLVGSIPASTASEGSEPYRPPDNSQAPQRPPRPSKSKVPSILDSSRVQDPTPVFQYAPAAGRASQDSNISSVASTTDFQSSASTNSGTFGPPRKSANLGPPPSARRGASSFYSSASYVSPIPEESPRSRGHTSYASSAAIPASFSPTMVGDDRSFDDAIAEESTYGNDDDERHLVRSASIGKRGRPSLVTTKSTITNRSESIPIMFPMPRPSPTPVQSGTFREGTAYTEAPSSSGAISSVKTSSSDRSHNRNPTADHMLNAFEAAGATDPSAHPNPEAGHRRLSALRPPRLNIDAVKEAEARGSLTSLSDLILRATRLASMIDRGKRPASRFDELDFPSEDRSARDAEKNNTHNKDRYRSGFSDMLASFPHPGAMSRSSGFTTWSIPFGRRTSVRLPTNDSNGEREIPGEEKKKARRCCGMSPCCFTILMIILLVVIVAAVIIPLEFFVIQKQNTTDNALSKCQAQLTCANGGTNVITDGVCSCICTNGFTGSTCTTSGSQGCTTTSFTSSDTSVKDITLGEAIPRLIEEAQANFSVSLSASTIISKFNSANLSCVAENALITFNGQDTRVKRAEAAEKEVGDKYGAVFVGTVTFGSDAQTVTVQKSDQATGSVSVLTLSSTMVSGTLSTAFETTVTATFTAAPSATPTSTTSAATATTSFTITQEVLDFSRVSVLYILQTQNLTDASAAQSALQRFFSKATEGGVTTSEARSLSLGGSITVDLVNLSINAGS